MTSPAVSVLMPVFNAERYLVEAVESVLAQTFTDFEFLIIDDGSKDRSLAILQGLAARDPRIQLVSRPNTGLVIALNEMLGRARGELIARMDADDVCLPDRFTQQVHFLRDHPDHLAVGSLVELIDEDGDRLCPFVGLTTHDQIDEAHLAGVGGAIVHPTLMVRKNSLVDLDGYRSEFYPAEDGDLFLRLAEKGRLANLPIILLQYRRHLESTGHLHHQKQVDAIRRAVAAARRRRGLPPMPTPVVAEAQFMLAADQYRMWAWWAFRAGNVETARKYVRKTLRFKPLSIASWRLAYCVFRGR